VDSHIHELQNRGISAASLSSEDVDENNLLKEAYAFLFRSPKSFLQNEKWRNMLRTGLEIATHWSPMQPKMERWQLNFQNWSPAGDSIVFRPITKENHDTTFVFKSLH